MKLVRAGGRLAVAAVAVTAIGIVGVQYEHAIARNIALSHELADMQRDVVDLRGRRDHDTRELLRLSDPQGAVPEIHDRLKFVGPKEELIYIKSIPVEQSLDQRRP